MTSTALRLTKKYLLGRPLRTSRLIHERITKVKALAVFSSDALSSVAYATEEILLVLVTAGSAAMVWSLPIALAIIALLSILTVSYRQTIHAYPSGGGAYIVAKDNLGVYPGLVAGAALLIDYVLTVAVSIASGVAAMTSALPGLYEHRVIIGLILIVLITLANLRGVRESATMFAIPTYLFILGILFMIGAGLYRYFAGPLPPMPTDHAAELNTATQAVTLLLIFKAFASGCTALTGIEAISNGVPAFKQPESRNASLTMIWMAVILGILFSGISVLARLYHIVPDQVTHQTVLSLITGKVFGRGIMYYYIQFATMMILVLAANTSYAGFPSLASMLAKDGFIPRLLSMRGDRLVFSNGIITLGAVASILIIIFQSSVYRLLPLYAVGVFLSFTLSQTGMVVRWVRQKEKGWFGHALINGIGAVVTGVVLTIIASAKFMHGAWVVVLLIPILVVTFKSIRSHYDEVACELNPGECKQYRDIKPIVIIPVASINKVVINTIEYAKSMTDNIIPVHICISEDGADRLRGEWKQWNFNLELLVIPSPYRSIFGPLLRFIERTKAKAGEDERVTVLIPEFVTRKWWHYFLHNQTGLLLKTLLIWHKDVVITSVPYHLSH